MLADGLAIMLVAFQELKIQSMLPGDGALRLTVAQNTVGIHVSATWLHAHPLSEYTLHKESREWEKLGFTLKIETT